MMGGGLLASGCVPEALTDTSWSPLAVSPYKAWAMGEGASRG